MGYDVMTKQQQAAVGWHGAQAVVSSLGNPTYWLLFLLIDSGLVSLAMVSWLDFVSKRGFVRA